MDTNTEIKLNTEIENFLSKNSKKFPKKYLEFKIDTSDYEISQSTFSSLAPLANANRRSTGLLVNVPNPVEQRFLALYRRYKKKKRIFQKAAWFYKALEIFVFMIPLLLIQLLAAIAPSIIPDDKSTLLKKVSTTLAAVTAIVIAADNKLNWAGKHERFAVSANGYTTLAEKAFYNYIRGDSTEIGVLQKFIQDALEVEMGLRENCPVAPEWIERSIQSSEERRNNKNGADKLENV